MLSKLAFLSDIHNIKEVLGYRFLRLQDWIICKTGNKGLAERWIFLGSGDYCERPLCPFQPLYGLCLSTW